MFTNGPITRGLKAQKKLEVEEREYIYDCGQKVNGIISGLTTEGYSNEYNNRSIEEGDNAIQEPTTDYPAASRWLTLFNTYNAISLIGTANAAFFSKRYLVVEARKSESAPEEEEIKLYVKLSRQKELEDDGELYVFNLTNNFEKYHIDLFAEDIQGKRYIAFIAGLFNNTNYGVNISRIYLTNYIVPEIIVTYDGDATKYIWQGWSGAGGNWTPGTVESNYLSLVGDGSNPSAIKTVKKIDFSGANFIGVLYECTAASQDITENRLDIGFYNSNSEKIAGFYTDLPGLTTDRPAMVYIPIKGLISGTTPSRYRNPIVAGIENMVIKASEHLTLKIKKVWLQ